MEQDGTMQSTIYDRKINKNIKGNFKIHLEKKNKEKKQRISIYFFY
jgi:hypothetical protein